MFSAALSSRLVALAFGAALVAAQDTTTTPAATPAGPPDTRPTFGAVPFAELRYEWGNIPYKADPDVGLIRGDQWGYNICNSTTENQESLCQTMLFNGIDDFCLWGPPEYGRTVGDIEGIMVAWCTKPGHGTRLIPEGALKGVQWTTTPGYIQVVGRIDQTMINILEDDSGGEMDPHGADLRGNPMGGIVFTEAWGGDVPQQAPQWHNFVGNDQFCFKVCDLRDPANYDLCENRLDRMGCEYNAPNNAQEGVFEECLGDNQLVPGIYTGADGVVSSYVQPWEGDFTVPYQPVVPASSQCTTYTSSEIYTGLPAASTSASSARETGTGTVTRSTLSRSTTGSAGAEATGDAANSEEGAAAARSAPVALLAATVLAAFYLA